MLGLNPAIATLAVLPIAFAFGFGLQRFLLQHVVGDNVLLVILVTFALSIIVENGLLEGFGADPQKISGGWMETATIALGHGINVGVFQVVTFAAAVILVAALDLLLYRTGIGAKIRAVSDDVAAANLIGLSSVRIYAIAMGISFVTVGVAAGFMSIWTNFDPASGPTRLLIAFEVIVLGGLGSLWGSLVGGVVLGVAQSIGGQFDIAWQIMAGHIVFLIVLALRPQGLFPKY
jgi:branched-chain amino acid transport system permease protein